MLREINSETKNINIRFEILNIRYTRKFILSISKFNFLKYLTIIRNCIQVHFTILNRASVLSNVNRSN